MAHLINLEDISLLFRRSKAPPDLGRERFTPDRQEPEGGIKRLPI